MKLTIPGPPIAQMRPRFRRCGKITMTYDPQSKEKEVLRIALNQQITDLFNDGNESELKEAAFLAQCDAFDVEMTFYMPIPQSTPKSLANAKSWGLAHNCKPDLDNLVKFAADLLNNIAFSDDAQIVSLSAKKIYSQNPRTEVHIMPHPKISLTNTTKEIINEFDRKTFKEFIYDCKEIGGLSLGCENPDDSTNREIFFESTAALLELFVEKWGKTLKKIEKITQKKA